MRKEFARAYLTIHGPLAVLTMNHPEVMNAASVTMVDGMLAALDYAEDEGARALILTGEGRGFCAGVNLTAEDGVGATPRAVGKSLDIVFHPLLRRLRDLNMPVVTAVNGAAAGVGMSIALMGDLVVASRSAYFLQAFARIGLVPDGGSTWLLPRLIGVARARELSLLAEKLSAEKALEWGLINRVCDDQALLEEASALAKRLADGPTKSLNMIRKLYWDSLHNSYEGQLDAERRAQEIASGTGDFIEGVMAFREKRPAKFQGK